MRTWNIEELIDVPVCKAASKQRAGRDGRVKWGWCYRMCTKNYHNMLPEDRTVSGDFLKFCLCVTGHEMEQHLPCIPLDATSMKDANAKLKQLSTLSEDDEVTFNGSRVCAMPIGPQLGVVAWTSKTLNYWAHVLPMTAAIPESVACSRHSASFSRVIPH